MDLLTWIIVGLIAGVLATFVLGGIGYGILRHLGDRDGLPEPEPEISFNYLGRLDSDTAATISPRAALASSMATAAEWLCSSPASLVPSRPWKYGARAATAFPS